MVAVRPTFHIPALLAKQAANIDQISGGRVSLNVVSSWWAEESEKIRRAFRSGTTIATADVGRAGRGGQKAWKEDHFSYSGKYYSVQDLVHAAEAVSQARPNDLCGWGI